MLAGLKTLIGLIIRRDRIKLPLILVLFVGTLIGMVPMLDNLYGDADSINSLYYALATNPAMLFLTGPIDEPSFGALMTIETFLWWGLAAAFINTMLVVRHTRHNEEIGAQELLLSGQTHRSTSLVAAMTIAVLVNLIIGLALGLGLQVSGSTWGVDQAWLYGAAIATFGLAWAGIAAVVVQLVESGRSSNGMLAGLIGLAFVLRGIGDFMGQVAANGLHQPAWLSYLSPFGWMQMTRPLTEPVWWPLVIPLAFWLLMMGLALVLQSKRDVGEGLLPSFAGKDKASRLLATPLGLTIRLQRNVFIGWLIGVLVMALTIGSMVPQMGQAIEGSDSLKQVIEGIGGHGQLLPSFMSAMMAISALLVVAYAIHALGRLGSEESSGRLESLLATKLSRLIWAGIHFDVILIGSITMLAANGLVAGLCINLLSDFQVDTWQYTLASLSYLPIVLAFMAIYMLLFGLLPRLASGLTWLYFGFVFFVLWLGPMVQLKQSIMNLSVMEHVSTPPAEDVAWTALGVITMLAVLLITVGFVAFRRRDLS